MTPCTLWYRRTPFDAWDFNHLQDGHVSGRPPDRSAWRGGEWEAKHAWLTDDVPPKVVHYGPDE